MARSKQLVKENAKNEELHKKKKRRNRQGRVALRKMKRLQKETKLLIPKKPFDDLVREIIADTTKEGYRLKKSTLELLSISAESHLIDVYSKSNKIAILNKHKTLKTKDVYTANKLM